MGTGRLSADDTDGTDEYQVGLSYLRHLRNLWMVWACRLEDSPSRYPQLSSPKTAPGFPVRSLTRKRAQRSTFAIQYIAMEQIVLQLKNTRKRKLLLDLLGELDFVKVTSIIRDGRKVAFANDLLDALMEAKADARGEKKLTRARDFLKHG